VRLEVSFSPELSERGNPADLHLSDSFVNNVEIRREYRHLLLRKDRNNSGISRNNGENKRI